MNIYIPVPFVDINNIVNQIHGIYIEALRITGGFDLGQITITFDKKKRLTDKTQPYVWAAKLIWRMEELDEFVKSYNGKLRFSEFKEYIENSSLWTIQQVKAANRAIDYLVDVIKENKLSPYEAVVFLACWSAENLAYNDNLIDSNGNIKNLELANSILPVTHYGSALCVGFSEFAKAVFDTVDFETLDSDQSPYAGILRTSKIAVSTNIFESKGIPDHCQNLIYIFDPKYGLDGKYIYDLTAVIDYISSRETYKTKKELQEFDNVHFMFSKEEIFDLLPDYGFSRFIDGYSGLSEIKICGMNNNTSEYFNSLKENTDKFTDTLGKTIPKELYEDVSRNCKNLARKYSLETIMKSKPTIDL